ncbi:MAG: inosine monophosphate cyclohydrolase [Gemmatimonadota bacterium]|nr:inosine monophosphate cyclohydrolase [Gemmatimonadota bacterium]
MGKAVETNLDALRNSRYPGRGIVIGRTPDARHFVQVYWIMGRSPGSRNRVFVADNETVRTRAFDESVLENPSLVVYRPIRVLKACHIVSNGDHTDTICDAIQDGGSFESALNTRTFEPDPPIFTPRIAGIVDLDDSGAAYRIGILKALAGNGESASRQYFSYETAIPGIGHCITTYTDDGDPPPAFFGEPYAVELHDGIETTRDFYWNLLDEANRVSLLVKFIDVASGNTNLRIVNKYRKRKC